MSNAANPHADGGAAKAALDVAIERLTVRGMNLATAVLLLANAVAIKLASLAPQQACDFLRATGDSFAPKYQGKELAEARRQRAAADFIKACA